MFLLVISGIHTNNILKITKGLLSGKSTLFAITNQTRDHKVRAKNNEYGKQCEFQSYPTSIASYIDQRGLKFSSKDCAHESHLGCLGVNFKASTN